MHVVAIAMIAAHWFLIESCVNINKVSIRRPFLPCSGRGWDMQRHSTIDGSVIDIHICGNTRSL